jgi:diguanylate cyclase
MAFEATLDKEMAKADEKERPLCILMIDIDFFKKFNDTYGHLAGDEVLKFVASSIKELVRGGDFTARFGGEEFVVLLPFTMLEGARAVGENIRSFFDRAKLKSRKGQLLGKVTVSIGGACMHNGETAEEFVQRADKALYYAKNNGRNMVAVDQLYNA